VLLGVVVLQDTVAVRARVQQVGRGGRAHGSKGRKGVHRRRHARQSCGWSVHTGGVASLGRDYSPRSNSVL
jgi:hypothetical protein